MPTRDRRVNEKQDYELTGLVHGLNGVFVFGVHFERGNRDSQAARHRDWMDVLEQAHMVHNEITETETSTYSGFGLLYIALLLLLRSSQRLEKGVELVI